MLGPQQHYLCQVECNYVQNSPQKLKMRRGQTSYEMSPEDKIRSIRGEGGQADYLIGAKERNSEQKQKFLRQTTC